MGHIFILIGPSGTGKTTLAERAKREGLTDSVVTYTTSLPRLGEDLGRDYRFLTPEDFIRRQQRGDFVDSEQIFSQHYGILRKDWKQAQNFRKPAILPLWYQGAGRLKRSYRPDVTVIGVLPPSPETLRQRLKKRTQSDDATDRAMRRLNWEVQTVRTLADYVVVNDVLQDAYLELRQWLTTIGLR